MYFYKKVEFKNGITQIGVYDENGKWIKWKAQDKPKIYFGIHKGKYLDELPKDYIGWLLKQKFIRNNLRKKLEELNIT